MDCRIEIAKSRYLEEESDRNCKVTGEINYLRITLTEVNM
jgi:hypothetical protein